MLPIQITVRDIPVSPTLEVLIRNRAEKLKRFFQRIMSCRIVLGMQQKHKHQGKLFNVRIDVTVPQKELVVTRKYSQDVYVAVRDAFEAIERQLEDHGRKMNGRVKTHEAVMHGTIVRLIQKEGYGFIEGVDGNEYYFSMTNVSHPDFTALAIGDTVEYIAEYTNDGRQAHRVNRERSNNTV